MTVAVHGCNVAVGGTFPMEAACSHGRISPESYFREVHVVTIRRRVLIGSPSISIHIYVTQR